MANLGVSALAAAIFLGLAAVVGCSANCQTCAAESLAAMTPSWKQISGPPGSLLSDSESPHCDDSSTTALANRYYAATSGSPSTLIAELNAQLGETGWSHVQTKGDHVFEKTVRSVHLWAQVSLYQGNVVDVVINDGPIPY